MSCLPRLKPKNFYDIVVRSGDHPPRAHRRQDVASLFAAPAGEEKPAVSLHPSLEPVLKRTLGVPLFQEQFCEWR